MKHFTNNRLGERGAAHFVALILFVALVGIVGFVGYNAWQRQTSNAGGKASLGQLQTQLKNAEVTLTKAKKAEAKALKNFNNKRKNEKKEDPEIAKLYTQLSKATKAASGLPSLATLNQRVAERQAEVTRMEGQVAEAIANLNAAKAARDAASKKNKPAKQAIVDDWKQKKENREAKLADARKELGKAQDKQKLQNAVSTLTAQIEARRLTWKQWTALVQARANVQTAQNRVNDLKKQVADAKKKSEAKKQPSKKDTKKAPANKIAYCKTGYKLNSKKTSCYRYVTYSAVKYTKLGCPSGYSKYKTGYQQCRKTIIQPGGVAVPNGSYSYSPYVAVGTEYKCQSGESYNKSKKTCTRTEYATVLYK